MNQLWQTFLFNYDKQKEKFEFNSENKNYILKFLFIYTESLLIKKNLFIQKVLEIFWG